MPIQPFILFDGVCNLCDHSVQFVLKREKQPRILFAALQSNAGKELAAQFKITENDLSSFIFVENGYVFRKSTAALKVCRHLKGAWPLCYLLMIVPRFLRDSIYDYVAKNRYKWYGKKESCLLPSPEQRHRFIGS